MAVGYRSASSTGVGDNLVSSINVPVPSGAASGDVALVALEMWESGNPTVTPPSGFTLITTVVSGSQKLKVFWKRLTGADSGNYTFSWTGAQWTIGHAILFTGVVASGDPIGSNFNSATSASGTSIPSTSVTVGFIPGLAHFCANENSATHTAPTSFTEVGESNYLATNYRLPGSSGTFTASGGTLSASTLSLALLVALQPASGGAVALDGIGSAAGSATGSLSADRPVSGSSPAASSATGALAADRPLSGSASAASSADASLSRSRPLDGLSTAAAGARGALEATRTLAGTASTSSGASGDLTIARALSGSAGSASDVSALLAVDRPFTGFAPAASSATGELGVDGQVALDGIAPAASLAAGDLSTARPLEGTGTAANSADGQLGTNRALSGTTYAASSAVGTFVAERVFVGVAASASWAAGELDVTNNQHPMPHPVFAAGRAPRAVWEAMDPEPVWSAGTNPTATWRTP